MNTAAVLFAQLFLKEVVYDGLRATSSSHPITPCKSTLETPRCYCGEAVLKQSGSITACPPNKTFSLMLTHAVRTICIIHIALTLLPDCAEACVI